MESVSDRVCRTSAPEDQARADFYALLSRLYRAAPDAALLAAIAAAPTNWTAADGDGRRGGGAGGILGGAGAASAVSGRRRRSPTNTRTLFIGVGQSEVSLHGSAYAKAARTAGRFWCRCERR